jgi:hypothetical protein
MPKLIYSPKNALGNQVGELIIWKAHFGLFVNSLQELIHNRRFMLVQSRQNQ